MAELPSLPKCREDCKGLCPRCGANLNNDTCSCDPASDAAAAPGDPSPDSSPEASGNAPASSAEPEPEWKRKMRELRDKM